MASDGAKVAWAVRPKAEFAVIPKLTYAVRMLNGIHIVDFGNHRNTRLTFGAMTAFVGKNGAGKTTAMRAVEEVGRAVSSDKIPLGPTSAFRRKGSAHEILAASWTGSKPAEDVDHGILLARERHKLKRKRVAGERDIWMPFPKMETPTERGDYPVRMIRLEDDLDHSSLLPGKEVPFAGTIEWRSRYFKAAASLLQGPSYSEDNPPSLEEGGKNLAWNLAYLMTAEPDRFARVLDSLREVVPIVKRIRARPVSIVKVEKKVISIDDRKQMFDQQSTVMGQELIFDMMSGEGLPASAVSEGTLVVLAVLTLLYGNETADLIMLDDVELGLHPQAQRDLIRQLRKVQEKSPELQIIVSTHSPYVIDEMKPEDVWLFSTDFEGCALSKRLSEHPDAKRAMEVLSTGEFWSAEGENWVRDVEPATRVAEEPTK